MISRTFLASAFLTSLTIPALAKIQTNAAGEYSKHFAPLKDLSVAVAAAMPPEHWDYRPHPGSMNFGALMSHIATTTISSAQG